MVLSENTQNEFFPLDSKMNNFNISSNHDCTCCLLAAIMFSLSTSGFRALYWIPKSCSLPAFLNFKIPSSTYKIRKTPKPKNSECRSVNKEDGILEIFIPVNNYSKSNPNLALLSLRMVF